MLALARPVGLVRLLRGGDIVSRARKSPPPALSGLIRQLPADAWSHHERALFLDAFTRCLDLSVPIENGISVPGSGNPELGIAADAYSLTTLPNTAVSRAHALDRPPIVAEGEDGAVVDVSDIDDIVWVRSTGRGTHDVMLAANPVPIVLASVMFTEGVKGRTLALERFAAALGSVAQDVQR